MKPDLPEDTLARQSDVTASHATSSHAEYNGFFIYVIACVAFSAWILWAFVPDHLLRKLSISYFPDQYWALAIPAYLLMAMLYAYIATFLYATETLSPPLNDVRCFFDAHSVFPPSSSLVDLDTAYVHCATAGVMDLPLLLVNEVLYSEEDQM